MLFVSVNSIAMGSGFLLRCRLRGLHSPSDPLGFQVYCLSRALRSLTDFLSTALLDHPRTWWLARKSHRLQHHPLMPTVQVCQSSTVRTHNRIRRGKCIWRSLEKSMCRLPMLSSSWKEEHTAHSPLQEKVHLHICNASA